MRGHDATYVRIDAMAFLEEQCLDERRPSLSEHHQMRVA